VSLSWWQVVMSLTVEAGSLISEAGEPDLLRLVSLTSEAGDFEAGNKGKQNGYQNDRKN
jgi:hypothetical protein